MVATKFKLLLKKGLQLLGKLLCSTKSGKGKKVKNKFVFCFVYLFIFSG